MIDSAKNGLSAKRGVKLFFVLIGIIKIKYWRYMCILLKLGGINFQMMFYPSIILSQETRTVNRDKKKGLSVSPHKVGRIIFPLDLSHSASPVTDLLCTLRQHIGLGPF